MKKIIFIGIIVLISFAVYARLDAPVVENGDEQEEIIDERESDEMIGEDETEIEDEEDIEKSDPEKEVKGEIAIIIDDLGYYPELNSELLKLEESLTLAILPSLENTEKAVNDFKGRDNFELILHMPMEPIDEIHREDFMLFIDHSKEEMKDLFSDALIQMNGQAVGVNNHKGSKFTSNSEKMGEFLELVRDENLFFVDSYTIGTSVGYDLAKELSISTAKRDVFLDYVDEKEGIRDRLRELEELALERGWAIAIGHHKENTIRVLQEELPKMRERGIKFVKVSELLN